MIILTIRSLFKKWPGFVRTTRISDRVNSSSGRRAEMSKAMRMRLATKVEIRSPQARAVRLILATKVGMGSPQARAVRLILVT